MTTDISASAPMRAYFDELERKTQECFELASRCRQKGLDPAPHVEIKLAKNMAERVVGLIASLAPQVEHSGIVERIVELEQQHGALDWRVALTIAKEIAQKKFCSFETDIEAMEVGIRTGFAYVTVGVVSSPLEGFTSLELKERRDGKGSYFCLHYAGPVRNAGGTAAAVSVLIADYVRSQLGYAAYDPTEDEVRRCATELDDYHTYVTNLQYKPHEKESTFLLEHLPVEISGIASEKREVSNYKDLPRVPTNRIRSGYCLIHSSCLPLKAEKLWKQLSKWSQDLKMEHWSFLGEYCRLKKELHDTSKKGGSGEGPKISANNTYIMDLVAGRPIIGDPMAKGGFRLRFGRSRASGFSGQALHPATFHVLDNFIATGTQLKVERPGKAATYTPCDTIEGPIVELENGDVVFLDTEEKALLHKKQVSKILFLGDVLINYGDFLNRAHQLVPPGYCEEWWIQELKSWIIAKDGSFDEKRIRKALGFSVDTFFLDPLSKRPTYEQAKTLVKVYGGFLHPRYTLRYADISTQEVLLLSAWLKTGTWRDDGELIIPFRDVEKNILSRIGCTHQRTTEHILISAPWSFVLEDTLGLRRHQHLPQEETNMSSLEMVNLFSAYPLRDKSGLYIGARMGRPEKSKLRHMQGSPHGLFPVGPQGGRMRSLQAAVEAGFVETQFHHRVCSSCGNPSPYTLCEVCGKETMQRYSCRNCGDVSRPCDKERCFAKPVIHRKLDIRSLFKRALKRLDMRVFPDQIKGVEGMINKEKRAELLEKAILRAKHDLYVNKDGTIRYDASEMTMTHFKPKEIGTPVERLRELGYTHDCYGKALGSDEQVLEIKPQDCVLPSCPDAPHERSDEVMLHTMQFIDDLLVHVYGERPYYCAKRTEDCVGQYLIGLAPHTSAGILMRCIGFSKTQGFFAHPLLHCAMRRDVDGDETCFFLVMDGFLNFSQRYLPSTLGGTMDAPLVLTSVLNPKEVDDMCFDCDRVWQYPLSFYEACETYKAPWEIKIDKIGDRLGTPEALEGMGFTHDASDINQGVLCSAYKTLPTMEEKLAGQMALAKKIRAVNARNVAKLVMNKHFLKDIKGNLRKFSQQSFRCVNCNTIYRRPPLRGHCMHCNTGKIIFTVAPGSVVKYVDYCINLLGEYEFDVYFSQTIELMKLAIDSVFGKEKEIQTGLGAFLSET